MRRWRDDDGGDDVPDGGGAAFACAKRWRTAAATAAAHSAFAQAPIVADVLRAADASTALCLALVCRRARAAALAVAGTLGNLCVRIEHAHEINGERAALVRATRGVAIDFEHDLVGVGEVHRVPDVVEFVRLDAAAVYTLGAHNLPAQLRRLCVADGTTVHFAERDGVAPLPARVHTLELGWGGTEALLRRGAGLLLLRALAHLELGADFDEPIGAGVLPTTLRRLVFGTDFNRALGVGVLPVRLERVVFGECYNRALGVGVLPASLRSLRFGFRYDAPIGAGVLPAALDRLVFAGVFNQALGAGVLPPRLRRLVLGPCTSRSRSDYVWPPLLASVAFAVAALEPTCFIDVPVEHVDAAVLSPHFRAAVRERMLTTRARRCCRRHSPFAAGGTAAHARVVWAGDSDADAELHAPIAYPLDYDDSGH